MGTSFLALDACGAFIHTRPEKVKKRRSLLHLFIRLLLLLKHKNLKNIKKQDAKCSRCSNYGGQSWPNHKSCCSSSCPWRSTSSARSACTQSEWGILPNGLSLRRRLGQGCH